MKTTIEIISEYQNVVSESKIPVVVVIVANWCGTCQIMVPILETLSDKYSEQIKFVMVDINAVEDVVKNCGLDKLPILLFFKEGNLIDQHIGTISCCVLEMKVKKLIENSSTNNIYKKNKR